MSDSIMSNGQAQELKALRERIAELERREQALRESEQRYRALLEHSWDMVIFLDAEGRLTYVSPSVTRILGYEPGELLGRDGFALGHPDEADRNRELFRAILEVPGKTAVAEYRVRHKDGSWRWSEGRAVNLLQDPAIRALVVNHHEITERKTAQERESLQSQLMDQVHDAVVLTDIQGHVTGWNRGAERLYGYSRDEILGQHVALLYPEEDRGTKPAEVIGKLQAQGYYELEKQVRKKTGEILDIHLSLSLLRDVAGVPVGMVGYSMDVTERCRAVEALRHSERLFRLVWDNSTDGMRLTDVHGVVRQANAAYCRLVGLPPEQVMGQPLCAAYEPARHAHIMTRHRERFQSRSVRSHFETEVTLWNGQRVWFEVGSAFLEMGGEGTLLLGIFRDVTGRKQAEQALRQGEELNRRIIEALPGGVVQVDTTGAIRLANVEAQHILGLSYDELTRRYVHDFAPVTIWEDGTTCPVEEYPVSRCLRSGQPHGPVTIGVRHPDGRVRWALFRAVPLLEPQTRQVAGAIVTFIDVTERKTLESQLRQAQKLEAVGRLAGGVAHDFNNLLTVINGFTDLLVRSLDPLDPRREYATQVRTAGDRAADLTRQLLAYSRQQMLRPVVLDLNSLIRNVSKMLGRLIGEDVELVLDLAPEPCEVRADASQLEQVIMNLAANARDAMPAGGRLTLATARVVFEPDDLPAASALRPGAYARLVVRDTGLGMDRATLERVFEPFFTTKEQGKGIGLGLASVYGTVKQSDGHIFAESELGRGSAFTIFLPQAGCRGTSQSVTTDSSALPRGTETVLVVEDEESVRAVACTTLRMHGYTVLEAADGAEALERLAGRCDAVNLLVTDVVMPRMDGRQLAERLSDAHANLKVLYLSGYTDDDVVRHGVRESEVAFLQKPFLPGALVRKVREVLDQ